MPLDYLDNTNSIGDASRGILGNITSGVISTAADMFGSIYNSTAGNLGADDLNTRDILRKVNNDALAFYDEHQDGVKAASFVAGMVIPGFAAMKALNMAKLGIASLGRGSALGSFAESTTGQVFTGKRAELLQTELKSMYEMAKSDTILYNKTLWSLYKAKAGENVIDAAIFEIFMVGTMNAHPYMEEYKESPFKSALISIGLGGGLGAAFGVIGAKMAVTKATGGVATAAHDLIGKFKVGEPVSAANAERYQAHADTILNFNALLKTDINDLTKELVEQSLLNTKGLQEEILFEIAPWLKKTKDVHGKPIPNEYGDLRPHIEEMLADQRFIGVQSIGLPNMTRTSSKSPYLLELDIVELDANRRISQMSKDPNFVGPMPSLSQDTATVFYRPSTGDIYHKEGVTNVGMAVDLKDYKLNIKTTNLYKVEKEIAFEKLTRAHGSAYDDAELLDEMTTFAKVKPENIGNIVMDPSHTARQHATLAWLSTQPQDVIDAARFNLRSDQATYEQAAKVVEARMAPGYVTRATALVADRSLSYETTLLSRPARDFVEDWIVGTWQQKAEFRSAMDSFLHQGKMHVKTGNVKKAEDIWNAGQRFRDAMRKEADAEGYVLMYRGIQGEKQGASQVESYTISPHAKSLHERGGSSMFGKIHLDRVHVDNIIINIGGGEMEILVAAEARKSIGKEIYKGTGKEPVAALTANENTLYKEFIDKIKGKSDDEVFKTVSEFAWNKGFTETKLNEIAAKVKATEGKPTTAPLGKKKVDYVKATQEEKTVYEEFMNAKQGLDDDEVSKLLSKYENNGYDLKEISGKLAKEMNDMMEGPAKAPKPTSKEIETLGIYNASIKGLGPDSIANLKAIYKGQGFDMDAIAAKSDAYNAAQKGEYGLHESTSVHIPDSGSTQTVDAGQLKRHLEAETESQIRLMMKNEFGIEEMSIRLNVKVEAVEAVMAGESLANIPAWARIASVKDAENSMLLSNRMVTLKGNPNVLEAKKMFANIDERDMQVGHEIMVRLMAAKHDNPIVNAVMDIYGTLDEDSKRKSMQALLNQFKTENIGEVNNAMMKGPGFQSADMMMRHLTDSAFVAFLGKQVTKAQDTIAKQLISPLDLSMRALRGDMAAMHEFANVYNKLLGLSGHRDLAIDLENGLGYIVQKEMVKGKTVETVLKNKDGSTFYITQPSVIHILEESRSVAKPILGVHNFQRELLGHPPLNDLGLYLPPPNLTGKYISYIIDSTGKGKTQHLIAGSAEELKSLETAYRAEVISKNPTLSIVTKGDMQEDWNLIHAYMDAEPYIAIANNQLKHGGTAMAHPAADSRVLEDILQGFQHQIISGVRKTQELYLSDLTQKLDLFSTLNQRYEGAQAATGIFKQKAPDAAKSVKNILLGVGQMDQLTTWKTANEFTSMMLERTTQGINRIGASFSSGPKGKGPGSEAYFDALNAEFKAKGIEPPWESYQIYVQSSQASLPVKSQRLVSAMNGMLSFLQIRSFDAAHILVNLASLPILTHSALMEGLPATTLSNGTKVKLPARLMYDAVRFDSSVKAQEMHAIWQKMGGLDQVTMEYRDLTAAIHSPVNSKGAVNALVDRLEQFQSSKFAETVTKPADFTEKTTRRYAMNLGFLAAKHAYPGIDDVGATIHAFSFADRIIGNYHSGQRPGMFQGTLGTALGLYQTYMTTFAQSVYKKIERGNFKQLTAMALDQAGIFGTSSWPGYQLLSQTIGEHMSAENYDLTTGTYRALPNPLAELILYGMPSMMGPNFSTRGAINPRIPTGPSDLAIVNTVQGVWNALGHTMNGLVTQPGIGNKGQAILEGLSLQSISRPVARLSEIAAGESITQKGHTVSNSDQVWSFTGVMSRILATRPREEQVVRDAMHLQSFYGAADREARGDAVRKLRIAIRGVGLDEKTISTVAQEYLKHGGSGKGWNSVMNEILVRTEEGTRLELLHKLEPNSPLRRMISDTR